MGDHGFRDEDGTTVLVCPSTGTWCFPDPPGYCPGCGDSLIVPGIRCGGVGPSCGSIQVNETCDRHGVFDGDDQRIILDGDEHHG